MNSFTFNAGSISTETVKDGNFDGIVLSMILVHGTANTAFVAGDLDLSKLNIGVKLNRDGKNHEIIPRNSARELLAGNINNALAKASRDWLDSALILVAAAAGIDEQILVRLYIPFGGDLNLNDGDDLTVYIDTKSCFGANVSKSECSCTWTLNETVGIEEGIPSVFVKLFQASQTTDGVQLDGLVTAVILENYEKDDLAENQPFESVTFECDKLKYSRSVEELYTQNVIKAPHAISSGKSIDQEVDQRFVLHAGMPVSGTKVRISFDSANQSADKTALIAYQRTWTKKGLKRFTERIQKLNAKHVARIQANAEANS